ncbi:MAG: amino acid permease [Pirellulaceae bacterium]|nr:amino acid permease [Pirellulaceae bacterium]
MPLLLDEFLAQSVSIAFYAIGFGEGVSHIFSDPPAWTAQVLAALAVTAWFALAWLGADVATKFQYVVMVVLFAAIAAFFAGGFRTWDFATVTQNTHGASDASFWMIFAIFFPAVTGFTQGVSMSGELKDPAKSLPTGTFLAVGLSAIIYIMMAIVFAGTVPGNELVADYGAMRRVSLFPWLVDAGVICATLSSALASFLGGPRILQSLASDRVFPWLNPFAVGHGPLRIRGVVCCCPLESHS